jgi:hypothetical protein
MESPSVATRCFSTTQREQKKLFLLILFAKSFALWIFHKTLSRTVSKRDFHFFSFIPSINNAFMLMAKFCTFFFIFYLKFFLFLFFAHLSFRGMDVGMKKKVHFVKHC